MLGQKTIVCSERALKDHKFLTVFITDPLPTGDRILVFEDGHKILEMPNGDKVFLCHGFSQLDSEHSVDICVNKHSTVYTYPNGNKIVTYGDQFRFIRRGSISLIADPENPDILWARTTYY